MYLFGSEDTQTQTGLVLSSFLQDIHRLSIC